MLVRKTPKGAPPTQTVAIALGCTLEMDDKTLLQEALCTLVAGPREVKAELNYKLPLSWVAFI